MRPARLSPVVAENRGLIERRPGVARSERESSAVAARMDVSSNQSRGTDTGFKETLSQARNGPVF